MGKNIEKGAVLDLVRAMETASYGPWELVNLPATMIIMRRGICWIKNRVITRGQVWGECDILLETPELIDGSMPHTMSYVEIFILHKAVLLEICRSFPYA